MPKSNETTLGATLSLVPAIILDYGLAQTRYSRAFAAYRAAHPDKYYGNLYSKDPVWERDVGSHISECNRLEGILREACIAAATLAEALETTRRDTEPPTDAAEQA